MGRPFETTARIDVRELAAALDWFARLVLTDPIAEDAALGQCIRGLLATRRWREIRIAPRLGDGPSPHVLDIHGVPGHRTGRS